ncbi:MAG: hypothetical protein ACR2GR_03790, partial [Rhodothermales bacterium]
MQDLYTVQIGRHGVIHKALHNGQHLVDALPSDVDAALRFYGGQIARTLGWLPHRHLLPPWPADFREPFQVGAEAHRAERDHGLVAFDLQHFGGRRAPIEHDLIARAKRSGRRLASVSPGASVAAALLFLGFSGRPGWLGRGAATSLLSPGTARGILALFLKILLVTLKLFAGLMGHLALGLGL